MNGGNQMSEIILGQDIKPMGISLEMSNEP